MSLGKDMERLINHRLVFYSATQCATTDSLTFLFRYWNDGSEVRDSYYKSENGHCNLRSSNNANRKFQ
jgi:hypothetical protein